LESPQRDLSIETKCVQTPRRKRRRKLELGSAESNKMTQKIEKYLGCTPYRSLLSTATINNNKSNNDHNEAAAEIPVEIHQLLLLRCLHQRLLTSLLHPIHVAAVPRKLKQHSHRGMPRSSALTIICPHHRSCCVVAVVLKVCGFRV